MNDFNAKPYIDFIQSHAKETKFSRGNEKYFICPKCNDGRENKFSFNFEKGVGNCKVCAYSPSAFEYAKELGYTSNTKTYKTNYRQWDYTDSKGNFLYAKRRFDYTNKDTGEKEKKYIPIIKIDNQIIEVVSKLNYGKTINPKFIELSEYFGSIPKVIFNYPRVRKSEIIFVVEGEKCAEKLQHVINEASKDKPYLKKYGATTVYDSLDVSSKHYINQLSGKIVIILPDNDKTGFEKADKAAAALKKYCRINIVKPEKLGLKDKEDVYDYFENKENTWNTFENAINEYIPLLGNNDIDRTKKFIQKYGSEIKHSDISGYYIWNGKVWEQNDKHVLELAKSYSIGLHDKYLKKYKENPENNREYKHLANKVASERAIKSILNLAQSDKLLSINESEFDANFNFLNLNNCTYDLNNHTTHKHTQDDSLTITLPYNYDSKAKCPVWENFLKVAFNNDKSVINYLQQIIGYSLTGENRLQAWWFLYGDGGRGKSTFANVLTNLLGSYGTRIKTDTIMAKDYVSGGDTPNPEIAKLRNKRLAVAAEVNEGHKLNESLIKDLTGGDPISARFLFQKHVSEPFISKCKLFLYGNHKPYVRGTDNGIWRRIKLIPFKVAIPTDKKNIFLDKELENEISGILNWSLEGLKQLQNNKYNLVEPLLITEGTKSFRSEMDVIGQFLDVSGYVISQETFNTDKEKIDYCKKLDYVILYKTLYLEYSEYCKDYGHSRASDRKLRNYLTEKGVLVAAGTGNAKYFYGLIEKKDK